MVGGATQECIRKEALQDRWCLREKTASCVNTFVGALCQELSQCTARLHRQAGESQIRDKPHLAPRISRRGSGDSGMSCLSWKLLALSLGDTTACWHRQRSGLARGNFTGSETSWILVMQNKENFWSRIGAGRKREAQHSGLVRGKVNIVWLQV